jgi:LacI family transcriptional regulator
MSTLLPNVTLDAVAHELNTPRHLRVRQLLRKVILEEFENGQKFYTERALIEKLKFSQPTIHRALNDLVGEGYLVPLPRRGFFVRRVIENRYIGFISPPRSSSLGDWRLEAIAEVCSEKNYPLHIYHLQRDERPEQLVLRIRQKPTEERLLMTGFKTETTLELDSKLREQGFETIVLGGVPDHFPGNAISLDHAAEARIVLDHLIGLGHRRILFMVNEPRQLLTTSRRANMIERALQEREMPESKLIYCDTAMWDSSYEAAYQEMHKVMAMNPQPTAVVPLSGAGCWAVLRYLVEHKIKVPDEISIFCFDPIPGNDLLVIPLTGLSYSQFDQAEQAVDLLWQERRERLHHLIIPELQIGASTGPALMLRDSSRS